MANTRGVFGLRNVRSRIRKNIWVPPEEVFLNEPTANTGYFGGGSSINGPVSTMDKVTYSTDTRSTVPGAFLSSNRNSLAATGNSTAGYFGGGVGAGLRSTMDKVTFVNDTTAAVPGAALSVARYYLAASSARANALPATVASPTPNIV
jgi:hypothetical protein